MCWLVVPGLFFLDFDQEALELAQFVLYFTSCADSPVDNVSNKKSLI